MDITINIIGVHSEEIEQALTNKSSVIERGTYPSMSGELSIYPSKRSVSIKLIELNSIGVGEYGNEYIGKYKLTSQGKSVEVLGVITPSWKDFTCSVEDLPKEWLEQ